MRKGLIVLIIACMLVSLCACGNKQSSQGGNLQSQIEHSETTQSENSESETTQSESTEIENSEGAQVGVNSEEQEPPKSTEEQEPPKNSEEQEPPKNSEEQELPKSTEEVGTETEPESETEEKEPVVIPNATYTVCVKTQGNKPMSDIDITIYKDATKKEVSGTAETDAQGKAAFSLPALEGYYITLENVKEGYQIENGYHFQGCTAEIVLSSSVIQGKNLADATLNVGDIMYDFTVTTVNDEEVKLSDLLKEKDMVMLNFWFVSCAWCDYEFPYMSQAYELYKDDIEIIALNPFDGKENIKSYQDNKGLPFKVAQCPVSWAYAFDITGYPTSIIIDRYGMIMEIKVGALTSVQSFTSLFEHYTADNYQQ